MKNGDIQDSGIGNRSSPAVLGYAKSTQSLMNRLNIIEGQVKGIKGMIEKKKHCNDVLTQIAAVQSALSSVSKLLIESHLNSCLTNQIKKGDDDAVREFMKTLERLL